MDLAIFVFVFTIQIDLNAVGLQGRIVGGNYRFKPPKENSLLL